MNIINCSIQIHRLCVLETVILIRTKAGAHRPCAIGPSQHVLETSKRVGNKGVVFWFPAMLMTDLRMGIARTPPKKDLSPAPSHVIYV